MSDVSSTRDRTIRDDVMGGVRTVVLESPSSWQVFHELTATLATTHVWRGQRRDEPLRSTFDRRARVTDRRSRDLLLETHLARFEREMDISHPGVLTDRTPVERWALGQHYGLPTPLLDWSKSPDIAAYFALEKRPDGCADCYRYVYALRARSVPRLLRKLKRNGLVLSTDRYVELLLDLDISRSRLEAQQAAFTMALNGDSIETNVGRWATKRPGDVSLVKFQIPTEDRDSWMRRLNAMSPPINGVTLQLDLRDAIDRCK
jgi:hypothetical protein